MLPELLEKINRTKENLHKRAPSLFVVLLVLILLFLFINHFTENKPQEDKPNIDSTYVVGKITFPPNVNFAGEPVPLRIEQVRIVLAKHVKSFLDNVAHIELLKERADYWFPIIEPILLKHNIPDDFKYVALIESNLSNVVSPQGAAGFWQLLESTASKYSLEVTTEVDERFDVIKSTKAAALYLKEAQKNFDNWTLTAASYNLGVTGVRSKLNMQSKTDYYSLKLNKETSIYLFKLIAVKELLSRPQCYAIKFKQANRKKMIRSKTISVDTTIQDLEGFALSHNVSYQILQGANPWIIAKKLNNEKRKKYTLEIPPNLNKGLAPKTDTTAMKTL
jgi:membrane-bound lytic murein transglycosylase D